MRCSPCSLSTCTRSGHYSPGVRSRCMPSVTTEGGDPALPVPCTLQAAYPRHKPGVRIEIKGAICERVQIFKEERLDAEPTDLVICFDHKGSRLPHGAEGRLAMQAQARTVPKGLQGTVHDGSVVALGAKVKSGVIRSQGSRKQIGREGQTIKQRNNDQIFNHSASGTKVVLRKVPLALAMSVLQLVAMKSGPMDT